MDAGEVKMEGNIIVRRKEQNYLLRCKSKFNTSKMLNLFKVTKKISTFRFKKLEQIKFLGRVSYTRKFINPKVHIPENSYT